MFGFILLLVCVGLPIVILSVRDAANRAALKKEEQAYEVRKESHSELAADWEYRFNVRLTIEEELQHLRWFKRDELGPPLTRILLVLLAMGALFGLVYYVFNVGLGSSNQSVIRDFLEVFFYGLMSVQGLRLLVIRPWKQRKEVLRQGSGETRTYGFNLQGISTDLRSEIVAWPEVRKVFQKRAGLLFELRDNTRIFFPDSAFDSQAQRREFHARLGQITGLSCANFSG